MQDALVSIAAGASQRPLYQAARRAGLAFVAVDRDPGAALMPLADARVVASSHDADAVLAGLRGLAGLRFRAVVTQSSGAPVATCARVAAALGLPGLEPGLAEEATSKPGQLALCERAGVPVPRHAAVRERADLARLGLAPPLVCKPARTRVGKAGIRVVRDDLELDAALAAAAQASPDGRIEVEEFLPGRDVVLAALFSGARLRPFALLDEDTAFGPDGAALGRGFRLPSTLAGTPLAAELVAHAARLVERLGPGCGLLWATFRVDPLARAPRARVLELHFDLAGDHLVEALLPAACDLSLADALIDVARRGALPERAPAVRPSVLRFLLRADLAQGGAAKLERLRALPGMLALELAPRADDASGRAGYCVARGGAEVADAIDRLLCA